jgi:hypothetical protein
MDGKFLFDTPSHVTVALKGDSGLYATTGMPLAPGSWATVLSDME